MSLLGLITLIEIIKLHLNEYMQVMRRPIMHLCLNWGLKLIKCPSESKCLKRPEENEN